MRLVTLLVALVAFAGVAYAACPDGIVDVQSETCDDGNSVNGDGCDANCQIEGNFGCDQNNPSTCCPSQVPTSPCSGNGFCSDGSIPAPGPAVLTIFPATNLFGNIANAHAVCQQNGLSLVPYDQLAVIGGFFTAPINRDVWTGYFTNPPGNWGGGNQYQFGHNTFGRTCWSTSNDPGPGSSIFVSTPSAVCTITDPQLFVVCYAGPGECTCDPTWGGGECVENTGGAVCGNSFLQTGETCDDGNTVPGDGCSASCQVEPGYYCDTVSPRECCPSNSGSMHCSGNGVCQSGTCVCSQGYGGPDCANLVTTCGDGIVEVGEQCDDGNTFDNDGCSSSCLIQSGFSCDNSQTPSICSPVCGDGILSPGEECDDGNRDDLDGCNGNCKLQPSWTCPTPGSPCQCSGDAGCNGGTCSAGTCSCPAGRASPSCQVPCDASTTCSGNGVCSTAGYPEICQCNPGFYGDDCSVQCNPATTCNGNGVCSPTGRCLCNIGSSGQDCASLCFGNQCICTVCGEFDAGTPGWGVTSFADLPTAIATCGMKNIEVTCPPAPIPGNDPVCTLAIDGLTFGSPPDIQPVPLPCRGVVSGDAITLQGASFQPARCLGPQLDVDATTRLKISNLGSSGQDGASVNFDNDVDVSSCSFGGDALARVPGGSTQWNVDSFFDIFYDVANPVTPNQRQCLTDVFRQQFGPVQFGDVNSPGCSAIRARVRSPLTIENGYYANFPGFPPVVSADIDGALTFRNNTFVNVPGRALNVTGAREMDVDGNIFRTAGGADSAVVYIAGLLPATGSYKLTANRNFDFYPAVNITHPTATAFWLANMDTSGGAFDISGNEHVVVSPGPTGLRYGLVLDGVTTTETLGGPIGTADVEDERFIAVANPLITGTTHYVARTPLPPNEDNFCDQQCPESVYTGDQLESNDTYVAEALITGTQVPGNPLAIRISGTTRTNRPHILPILSFDPIVDADTPRWQDSCASRPVAMEPPYNWTEVTTFDSAVGFNGWTFQNTTAPSGMYDTEFQRDFALGDLLACHEYNNPTNKLVTTVSNGTYTFQVCYGFYEPLDQSNETAGYTVVHKGCVSFQFNLVNGGSAIDQFTTNNINFEGGLYKSEFLPNGHLQIQYRTRFEHFEENVNNNLREAEIALTSGNLGAPVTWTLANPSSTPCEPFPVNPDPTRYCLQTWVITSNAPVQQTQPEFLGTFLYRFRVYDQNGTPRAGTNRMTSYSTVTIRRTISATVASTITANMTIFRDQALTTPYNQGADEEFLVGEFAYLHVQAENLGVNLNSVNLTATLGIWCTPLFPNNVLPYNPTAADTTGCNTPTAGFGTNKGTFYPNFPQFESFAYKPSPYLYDFAIGLKVDPLVGDRVVSYVQVFFDVQDMSSNTTLPTPAHAFVRMTPGSSERAWRLSLVSQPTSDDSVAADLLHVANSGIRVRHCKKGELYARISTNEDGKDAKFTCLASTDGYVQKHSSYGYDYFYYPDPFHHNNHHDVGAWVWIVIIAVVLIGGGVGLYLCFASSGSGSAAGGYNRLETKESDPEEDYELTDRVGQRNSGRRNKAGFLRG